MVYCGKPSKGCLNCRIRKIRCDQKTPACSQCVKTEKVCPGYRDMLDLSFRNESDAVIEKAKAKAAKLRKSPNTQPTKVPSTARRRVRGGDKTICKIQTTLSTFSSASYANLDIPEFQFANCNFDIFAQYSSIASSPTSQTLGPSPLERGTNYFFANFVGPQTGPTRPFHYLHDIFRNNKQDGSLTCSIAATGLAGLANISKSNELMSHARTQYASALRHINLALGSPSDAVKDSTLISIVILAIFESVTGAVELSMKEWTEHINGAAELVRLRGRSQFQTPVGRGIFFQATSHLLISCVQRSLPVPDHIIELRNEAFGNDSQPNPTLKGLPSQQLMINLDQYTILRAAICNKTLTDPLKIINASLKVDSDLTQIFADVPRGWQYETAFTPTNTDILYDGYYDIYTDSFVSRIWDSMRAARIMLNQTIRDCLLDGFQDTPARFTTHEHIGLFQLCTDNIIKLRDDILHSVPQNLGLVNRKPFQTAPTSPPPQEPCNTCFLDMLSDADLPGFEPPPLTKDPNSQAISGYQLLWPLCNSQLSTPEIKAYAQKILRYISDEMGIGQGRNIAAFMERSEPSQKKRLEYVGLSAVAAALKR
ncbi:hypothetical protein LSUE1_G007687 [Lachnellula suecica]|uniref:Zn(2)-C6 fungal-type domain-containing protein n=1 Tax=Lachnellula suecica TaxID=602035 RepID=A0A8T9BUP2_9HELO|nr:hypothetical protein LSUE1_G007687 [Lachnellula suecica]